MYKKQNQILLYQGFTLRVKCQDRQPGLALALYYLNLAEAPILWAYGGYRSGCGGYFVETLYSRGFVSTRNADYILETQGLV